MLPSLHFRSPHNHDVNCLVDLHVDQPLLEAILPVLRPTFRRQHLEFESAGGAEARHLISAGECQAL